MKHEKASRLLASTEEMASPSASAGYGSATPPQLLGLSNSYARIDALMRSANLLGGGDEGGATTSSLSSKSSTFQRVSNKNEQQQQQQPLPSVDLTKVSSNVNKYYTLTINCTRKTNESFV